MAAKANHPWPHYASCEAALESNYGQSGLAVKANNLFGEKWHESAPDSITMPTHEFIDGRWVLVQAKFAKYPDLSGSFADRLATLTRLAPSHPHYAAALAATDGKTFITEVSQTWSTDPLRAGHVLNIYWEFFGQEIS